MLGEMSWDDTGHEVGRMPGETSSEGMLGMGEDAQKQPASPG